MATIVVSFYSEQEVQDAVNLLAKAGLGEVRARVLDSSEPLSYQKDHSTSPMIVPDIGSVEVRPTESPEIPEAMHKDSETDFSAVIPTKDMQSQGVRVMIEVNDDNEEMARRLLSHTGPERE